MLFDIISPFPLYPFHGALYISFFVINKLPCILSLFSGCSIAYLPSPKPSSSFSVTLHVPQSREVGLFFPSVIVDLCSPSARENLLLWSSHHQSISLPPLLLGNLQVSSPACKGFHGLSFYLSTLSPYVFYPSMDPTPGSPYFSHLSFPTLFTSIL